MSPAKGHLDRGTPLGWQTIDMPVVSKFQRPFLGETPQSPRMEGIHLCASSWAPAFTEPSRAARVLQRLSRMSIQGENVRTITGQHRTTRNLIWEAKTYPKPRKTDEKTSKNTHHPPKKRSSPQCHTIPVAAVLGVARVPSFYPYICYDIP